MKKLKKTKAKLPANEQRIGSGVSIKDLNPKRLKKLRTLKQK